MSEQTGTALAPRAETALSTNIVKPGRGKENIEASDIRIPYLSIAQKTSDAVDETQTGKYIDGLKFLQMYNPDTRTIYGLEVEILPIMMRKRACLVQENGKMGDEIAFDDPRASWDHLKDGQDKPEALQIYDWIVLTLPHYEPAIVSFKSKGFSAGKVLNGFIAMKPGDAWEFKYKLLSMRDENDSGVFGKFGVKPAGKTEQGDIDFVSAFYNNIAGKDFSELAKEETLSDSDDSVAPVGGTATPAPGGKVPF